jgi:hypothetical protein
LDLGARFSQFQSIGNLLLEKLRGYGQQPDTFTVSSLRLHYDISTAPIPQAPEFIFERRAKLPYNLNTFFSAAPLTTDDHMVALELLEKIFRET